MMEEIQNLTDKQLQNIENQKDEVPIIED